MVEIAVFHQDLGVGEIEVLMEKRHAETTRFPMPGEYRPNFIEAHLVSRIDLRYVVNARKVVPCDRFHHVSFGLCRLSRSLLSEEDPLGPQPTSARVKLGSIDENGKPIFETQLAAFAIVGDPAHALRSPVKTFKLCDCHVAEQHLTVQRFR